MSICNSHIFFFFQAEDGIRDDLVTGVQTCALPISIVNSNWSSGLTVWDWLHGTLRLNVPQPEITIGVPAFQDPKSVRSEERRVGKSVDLGGRRIIKKKKKEERSLDGTETKIIHREQ